VAAGPSGFRELAPGSLTVIPADRSADDPLQRGDLVEVTQGRADLGWAPKRAAANTTFVERSRGREYPRDIWCLEFAFKPPRQIDVDVPAAELKMQRKRVWYLVYRVRNVGGRRLVPGGEDAGTDARSARRTESFEVPIRFLPHLVLESLEPLSDGEGLTSYRGYLDRIVPSAMEAIRRREDPQRRFLDSAEMGAAEIKPGEERWGVAIWEDVDPRIDFFSIYVRGLTNAIRWRQVPGSTIGAGDPPGAHVEEALESLRLDFWRPGAAGGDGGMSVGFAGMFERMALGGRLLETVGWPGRVAARPVVGLEQLGLGWADLLEPEGAGDGASLLPLETVFRRLAAIGDPQARGPVVRDLVGDLGVVAIEELARSAAGPVDPERDRVRREALAPLKLSPEAVEARPLESLAQIMRFLESSPSVAQRRTAAEACFGPAARRVEWLAKSISMARALATLEAIDADLQAIAAADALGAFEAGDTAIAAQTDTAERRRVVRGLFGPKGPEVYENAARQHEGIDHTWVFRYETDVGSL